MKYQQTCSSLFNKLLLTSITIISFQCAGAFAQTAADSSFDHFQSPDAIPDLGSLAVTALDTPNDNGGHIDIDWVDPGYENLESFGHFNVTRRAVTSGDTLTIAQAPFGTRSVTDEQATPGQQFIYTVTAVFANGSSISGLSMPAHSIVQWFNFGKISVVIIGFLVCGAVIYFIETARRGKKLFLRRIAGLEAIDEAVGRATEMGRPVLFVAGTQDMDDVQTLAGLTILGRVSRTIAQYDSQINMPCRSSLVMTAGREIIKEAYSTAGRPDNYSDDMVHYTTDEQFGYVAAINGIMVREKPATCFYLGAFFAESLMLAEIGNSIDAIQIAGTAMPAQLPFFVAACDYTLIGEELFAASAYLSNEPKQLGSLKGQDLGKAVAMCAIILGTIAVTISSAWNVPAMKWLADLLHRMFAIS
jgi:hypothetical protein